MSHSQGYSLLELLITLSISSILLTTGIPAFSDLIDTLQSKSDTQQLTVAIHLTRQQAVTHKQTTTLCPHQSNNECSTDWASGLMIFSDNNSNGKRDTTEAVIRVLPEFKGTLRWASFGSNNYLRYTPNGFTLNQNGSFHYCTESSKHNRRITINRAGRPYTNKNASC